jgi:cyanophycin synthetase
VIENNAEVILGQGLAYDRCQVGVVTGIEPELHYGRFHLHTPEHVFRVFRTQVDVVLPGGTAVLPADNPLAVEMIPLCDGEVILFAGDPALPLLVAHRADGGRVVTVHQDHVVLATAADETALAPLTGIPFLSSGLHPGRVASVLAAVAAAWALGLPLHVIRTGLETFSSHPAGPDAPVPLNPAAPGSIVNPP